MDAWSHSRAQWEQPQGCSYTSKVTKMGRIITGNVKHICATPVSAEQHLHKQIWEKTG